MDNKIKSFFVLGTRIDVIQIPEVIEQIFEWIKTKKYGNYIVFSNAFDVISSKKDIRVRTAVDRSTLSVPDGISLVWLANLKGHFLKKRVYGPDLMFECLKLSESEGYSHFFYGATQETLSLLVKNLKERFPRLKVAGAYAPPFRALSPEEDRSIIEMIDKACPDIVWVGLGCPKQQLWMHEHHEHKDKLKVPVMLGVGAAFDFFAKTKPQASGWIRDSGFEWLFRLATEPKRLWKRYLIYGSLFVYYVSKELLLSLIRRGRGQNHV